MALVGDGSAMYTVQALLGRWHAKGWTLPSWIFANRVYKILRGELTNVGVSNAGPKAMDMLSLDQPTLEFSQMAKSMGVEATQVTDCAALELAIEDRTSTQGPLSDRSSDVAPAPDTLKNKRPLITADRGPFLCLIHQPLLAVGAAVTVAVGHIIRLDRLGPPSWPFGALVGILGCGAFDLERLGGAVLVLAQPDGFAVGRGFRSHARQKTVLR